ncbi:MAG: selenocysteine-specific translation elongation factor [bacterium]
MKHLILGTAGHVDHGKTALVKALTGVDTDRLEEEKRRGITIDLGFAELTLPGEIQIGIVDVPGHERFINNMLSGVGGMDLVMLVIAADEGIMPQTREHFDICRLLSIPRGLTVITKTDLVDGDWLHLVTQEIEALTKDTFLEGGGIYPVSSKTGQGIPELLEGLRRICEGVESRGSGGVFRLPVDRVFTMKGFGTVVTGTLVSGRVGNGETVEILPGGLTARVRGVQVHDKPVNEALAGQRTALNLQGVEKDRIERGDTVTTPGLLTPTFMLDARITLLPDVEKPMKNRRMIRFYNGAARCSGVAVLLGREELPPGGECYAQIRLSRPVVVMGGDRFILRSASENRTIGGGSVLDPMPVRHKTSDRDLVPALEILEKGKPEEKAEVFLRHAGYRGMDLAGFRCRLPIAQGPAKKILQTLREKGRAVTIIPETLHLLHEDYDGLSKEKVINILKAFHENKPLEPGMPKAELFSRFSVTIQEKVFQVILGRLEREGKVHIEENLVRLSEHKVSLNQEEEAAIAKIRELYRRTGLKPPSSKALPETLGLDVDHVADLMRHLMETGRLVHIQGDLFMDPASLQEARDKVRVFLDQKGEISVSEMRDLLDSTRKYLIPLLEYFDAAGFTARKGDKRILR